MNRPKPSARRPLAPAPAPTPATAPAPATTPQPPSNSQHGQFIQPATGQYAPSQYAPSQYQSQYPPPPQHPQSQHMSPYRQPYEQYEESQPFEESQAPWGSQPQPPQPQPSRPSSQMSCPPANYRNAPDYSQTSSTSTYPRASSQPGPAKPAVKASEVLLSKMADLDAKLDANKDSLTNLRDMIHNVRASLRAIPTRQEVKDDIGDLLAPILTEFQSNILTDVKDTVRHLPTADEVVDKVRPILNDGQATERRLTTLMDHLLSSLRPVDELTTSIQSLRGLEAQQAAIFQRTIDSLHAKIDQLSSPLDLLNSVSRVERRLDNLDNRIDRLPTDTIALHRDIEMHRPPVEVDIPALSKALYELEVKRQEEAKRQEERLHPSPPITEFESQAPTPVHAKRKTKKSQAQSVAPPAPAPAPKRKTKKAPSKRKSDQAPPTAVDTQQEETQSQTQTQTTRPSKKRKPPPPQQFVRRSERRRSEPQRFGRDDIWVKSEVEEVVLVPETQEGGDSGEWGAGDGWGGGGEERDWEGERDGDFQGDLGTADTEAAGLLMAISQGNSSLVDTSQASRAYDSMPWSQ